MTNDAGEERLTRTPPIDVRRKLRSEVGFGCPVEDCGSPFLKWHHFDPPWRVRHHHDPAGMIALCPPHHDQADVAAFTDDQLRALKTQGRTTDTVGERFNWMRNDLFVVFGGNFHVGARQVLASDGRQVVWFNRAGDGSFLLNIEMLTISGEPRLSVRDNDWLTEGRIETDIDCPPSGKLIAARYPNGDFVRIEFVVIHDAPAFGRRYPPPVIPPRKRTPNERPLPNWWPKPKDLVLPPNSQHLAGHGYTFPLTAVEIQMKVGGTKLDFGARRTTAEGGVLAGNWIGDVPAISIGDLQFGAPPPPER